MNVRYLSLDGYTYNFLLGLSQIVFDINFFGDYTMDAPFCMAMKLW